MDYNLVRIDGRLYRYSRETKETGLPVLIQHKARDGSWRDTRNQDRIDQIRKLATWEDPTVASVHIFALSGCMDIPHP